MKSYLRLIDLLSAAIGALLVWNLFRYHRWSSPSLWPSWLVFVAMVVIPAFNFLRKGDSTIIGETVVKYLGGARDILRDRRGVWMLVGLITVGSVSSGLVEWAFIRKRWPSGSMGGSGWDHLGAYSWSVNLPRDVFYGAERVFHASPGAGSSLGPYLFGFIYLLLLSSVITCLAKNREKPGYRASSMVVAFLGCLVVFIGFTGRSIYSLLDFPPTVLAYLVAFAGHFLHLAFWSAVSLILYNALLVRRTGREVDWLPAFASRYAFGIILLLIWGIVWLSSSLLEIRHPSGFGSPWYMGTAMHVFNVVDAAIHVAVLFVPAIIALNGVGVREAIRRSLRLWSAPWRAAVFAASLSILVLLPNSVPRILTDLLTAGPALRLRYALYAAAIPLQTFVILVTFGAIGVFVLESTVDSAAEPDEQATPVA